MGLEKIIAVAAAMPPETVTLRAVGKALGVSGQALYRYVDSTEHLVELVAASCWPAEDSLPAASVGWYEWYRQALWLLRQSFLAVPALSKRAAMTAAVSPRQLAFTEVGLQCFTDAGVPPSEGILYFRLLINATFDHVLRTRAQGGGKGHVQLDDFWRAVRDSDAEYPQLRALVENHRLITAEEAFELAVSALLTGIAAQAGLETPERALHGEGF
ncbi:MAG: TetR/AcrR family transcriptional regulator C-terminal domain-containing protein [Pseudomonadota bacterium]